MNTDIFWNQILLESINADDNPKKFKAKRYYLPKGIINNYYVIINRKNFYDQATD